MKFKLYLQIKFNLKKKNIFFFKIINYYYYYYFKNLHKEVRPYKCLYLIKPKAFIHIHVISKKLKQIKNHKNFALKLKFLLIQK